MVGIRPRSFAPKTTSVPSQVRSEPNLCQSDSGHLLAQVLTPAHEAVALQAFNRAFRFGSQAGIQAGRAERTGQRARGQATWRHLYTRGEHASLAVIARDLAGNVLGQMAALPRSVQLQGKTFRIGFTGECFGLQDVLAQGLDLASAFEDHFCGLAEHRLRAMVHVGTHPPHGNFEFLGRSLQATWDVGTRIAQVECKPWQGTLGHQVCHLPTGALQAVPEPLQWPAGTSWDRGVLDAANTSGANFPGANFASGADYWQWRFGVPGMQRRSVWLAQEGSKIVGIASARVQQGELQVDTLDFPLHGHADSQGAFVALLNALDQHARASSCTRVVLPAGWHGSRLLQLQAHGLRLRGTGKAWWLRSFARSTEWSQLVQALPWETAGMEVGPSLGEAGGLRP